MLSLVEGRRSRRIVDIACGTGILAARIAKEVKPDAIYGVDLSEGMLAQARLRSTEVHWLTAPAERLPFDDGSLDAVLTTSAFHFFNQPAALGEFRRVLAPGGVAAVATFSPFQPLPMQWLASSRFSPLHGPSPNEMCLLFADAGFELADQQRVRRPVWTSPLSDLITVGVKAR